MPVRVVRLNPVPFPIRSVPSAAAEASIPVPPRATPSCWIDVTTPDALFTKTPEVVKEEKVIALLAERVVKAAVEGVVAPIAVEFIPVALAVKLEEVMVRGFAPVEIDDADRPERLSAPDVAVRFMAPLDRVNPFDALKSPADVTAPDPVVVILPEVVKLSPAVEGEIVDVPLFLVKNPTVPEVLVVVMLPLQTRLPFDPVIVHPLLPDPPASAISPFVFMLKSVLASVSFLMISDEPSTKIE